MEIEQVSTGVSLWATVSDGPELHAMTPVDGGTWTAWRIEKPTCGEVDAEGNIPVVQQVIELVDDEPEVYPSGQMHRQTPGRLPTGWPISTKLEDPG